MLLNISKHILPIAAGIDQTYVASVYGNGKQWNTFQIACIIKIYFTQSNKIQQKEIVKFARWKRKEVNEAIQNIQIKQSKPSTNEKNKWRTGAING